MRSILEQLTSSVIRVLLPTINQSLGLPVIVGPLAGVRWQPHYRKGGPMLTNLLELCLRKLGFSINTHQSASGFLLSVRSWTGVCLLGLLSFFQMSLPVLAADSPEQDVSQRDGNERMAKRANLVGVAFFNVGNYELALSRFDNALRLDPNKATIHANRAAALFRLACFLEARRALVAALEINPELELAHTVLSLIERDENSKPEALSYQPPTSVPQLGKDNWWSHWQRAETHLKLDRGEEARQSMDRARKSAKKIHRKSPEWRIEARHFLAYAANRQGNASFLKAGVTPQTKEKRHYYKKAMQEYENASRWEPTNPVIQLNRSLAIRTYVSYLKGKLKYRLRLLETARHAVEVALKVEPDYARAQKEIGWILNAEGIVVASSRSASHSDRWDSSFSTTNTDWGDPFGQANSHWAWPFAEAHGFYRQDDWSYANDHQDNYQSYTEDWSYRDDSWSYEQDHSWQSQTQEVCCQPHMQSGPQNHVPNFPWQHQTQESCCEREMQNGFEYQATPQTWQICPPGP
ncbi:tetratricopeptide repeat protein [Acidobacteria bacterium AH-259-L09]|nr:tetratricopeptide repeat protein [Acidobacteria bacterium AH-259-L09]